jgi:hypothetical protein
MLNEESDFGIILNQQDAGHVHQTMHCTVANDRFAVLVPRMRWIYAGDAAGGLFYPLAWD